MLENTHYDYLIAGAGAAGLSLAYQIAQNPTLCNKKILLIDKVQKKSNDRTWCFWAKDENQWFQKLAFRQWEAVWFKCPEYEKKILLSPYSYWMIKSIDFYTHTLNFLENQNQVHFLYTSINQITADAQKATINTDEGNFTADWVFDSTWQPSSTQKKGYHYFLQHFKGYVISTPKPLFDPEAPVFMDFRIDQKQETRFVYILPYSPNQALVEFTIFSENLLPKSTDYDQVLEDYIINYLQCAEYTIEEIEQGVIPMFDIPFKKKPQKRVMNIGIGGGAAKASTGYAFWNIQQETEKIVKSLATQEHPFYAQSWWQKRFRFYDALLLSVLQKQKPTGAKIFSILFKKHPVKRLFSFLNETSHFGQELQIMSSVPPLPFLKGIPKTLRRS
ncbi:MAG: lycopene cyclase [Cytophagales bacterium]|nr:MAG: lycopene cyclase [Cytophagales bacterium]